jgi:hypothetical protein
MAKKGLKGFGKKGQTWETLIPWIIAIGVLVLMFVLYLILSGKGQAALTFIKNLLRFGK